MKKTVLCILLLAIFVAAVFGAFYFIPLAQEQNRVKTKETKVEEVETALIQAGYDEAHKTGTFIYLDNTNTDYISVFEVSHDFVFNKKRDDIPQILDAVMPLYDSEYNIGDGEQIVNRLNNDRLVGTDSKTYGGHIIFKNCTYNEFLDETGKFTDGIMVVPNK